MLIIEAAFFQGALMNIHIGIPEKVKYLIGRLQNAGYKAYVVGGCVRDSIMGRIPEDWDICTSALPEETESCLGLPSIVKNGIKHGTVTVRYLNESFEITTFRMDGSYSDNRRPESVTFVDDITADLSRRDLTVNALAYNDEEGLIDCFGGYDDIKNGIIRCVGVPADRFNEDGLRLMRTVRFASVLGFGIEENTARAVHENKELLCNISAERLSSELVKLLSGKNAEKILTEYPDLIGVFIPELLPMVGHGQMNPHHVYDVWTHTVKVMGFIANERLLKLAALFHDFGKPDCFTIDEHGTGHFHGHPKRSAELCREIMKRLKFDNKTMDQAEILIKLHDLRPPAKPKNVRRLLSKTGEELFPKLLELKRADALAQSSYMRREKLRYIDDLRRIFEQEIAAGSAYCIKMLKINGSDLISAGFVPGQEIGMILKGLLDEVIEGNIPNEREALLSAAGTVLQRSPK